MSSEPSESAQRAWARLTRAQRAALASIERALKAAELPPLVWYDALLELDRGPDAGLRPVELEREMLLPQYGLSRLIDRMEAAGLVERRPFEADGRGQIVAITPLGRETRRRMWPVYARAIQESVGDRLAEEDLATLNALLGRLLKDPGSA